MTSYSRFFMATPLLLSLWGSGFIREMQTGCIFNIQHITRRNWSKTVSLEMTGWPWWEPSGSMIPLQIDLWCHSIKGWGTFPCAPTNYGRWRAECKASSLLSWMAHTSSSSLGMCPESDGFFFLLFLLFSQVLLSYIWKVVDVEP